MKKAIQYLRMKRIEHLQTPTSAILYLTNKCNLKCTHCFYSAELNNDKKHEMTLEQIQKMVDSFKQTYGILLTGGEPFLRQDIIEVFKILENKFKTVTVVTNGFFHEKTLKVMTETLERFKFKNFIIRISIDGPQKIHDEIRGVPNSYERAITTLKKLKTLEKKYPNFEIAINAIISSQSHNHLPELIKDLIPYQVPISFLITRGSDYGVYKVDKDISSEIIAKEQVYLDINKIEQTVETIKKLNEESPYKFWTQNNQQILEESIRMIKTRTKKYTCYAGKIDGVIYENGDVSMCELTKPIGNLKETNYDFKKLWNSDKANAMRKRIKKCYCIHGCFLSTSIAVNTTIK